jgi:Ca2+-binding EF-hand superfamily protein
MFDKDGSGQISRDEVKAVLGSGGNKFGSDKVWDDIIREVDVDGNGEIDFSEFKIMMQKFLEQGHPDLTES